MPPRWSSSRPVADRRCEEASLPGAAASKLAAFWLTPRRRQFRLGLVSHAAQAPGRSGYHTISAALRERYEQHGPWTAAELTVLGPAQVAAVLGQAPEHELMALFARSLNDLGEACRGRARRLVRGRGRRRRRLGGSRSRSGSGAGPASPTARATASSSLPSSNAPRSPPPILRAPGSRGGATSTG